MNKRCLYAVIVLLSFTTTFLHAQGNQVRATANQEQADQLFYHTIERGQTVYAIATMYSVDVDDIYRLNPESKEGIKTGSVLKIPQKDSPKSAAKGEVTDYTYHTIRPKETLYAVSTRYSVSAENIIRANPGLSTTTFHSGKIIRIPTTLTETIAVEESRTVTKMIEYTVERKETLYRLCRKFDLSSNELIKHNPELKNGVRAGMVLKIPVQSEENVTATPTHPVEREVNALLSAPQEIKRVDRVKVALLLPFMTEEAVPSATTARFIEYYEGLLLAVDSMRNMGCNVELSVFDTGNGTKRVNEILKEEALKEANLIIGAVQNEQIAPVARFAEKNNIKYVIPFTSKNDDVLSNASVFQVNTPHSYLYSKAAQAGADLFADHNIILLNIKDKEEKEEFVKSFKSELKGRSIAFKELTFHGETFQADLEKALSTEKRNVIVPTSSSLDALNKIKSPIRLLAEAKPEYGLTLFGYPEWQTYTRECLEDFYALNAYMYSNFYADNLSANVYNFYTLYKTWYSKNLINTFPKYGILGFDTGMYFLTAIRKYGSNFENNLDKINYASLQTGFNFQRVNNWGGFINTNIFVVHYKNDYSVTRTELR